MASKGIRTTDRVYKNAESAFETWWDHLADDKEVEDVDKKSTKQAYVEEFVKAFRECLKSLDEEHPENLEEHHRYVDRHSELLERIDDPAYRDIRSNNQEYFSTGPRWRQNIAADGRREGLQAAEADAEVDMGFRESAELEKLAWERFSKVWENLAWDIYFETQVVFDYPALREIYVHNFTKSYTQNTGGRQDTPAGEEISTRVITTKRLEDALVYVIEINDPQNLDEPARVVVTVDDEGNTEAQEVDDDQ